MSQSSQAENTLSGERAITRPAQNFSRRCFNRALLAGVAISGIFALSGNVVAGNFTRLSQPAGDIPYNDIDALIEDGWLPDYRDTGKSFSAVERDALKTTFDGQGGERNEIGLVPEEMAAYIATRDRRYRDHVIRLADEISYEDWHDFAQVRKDWGIEYAHTPSYWYCAGLLTGDKRYFFADEQIYRGWMQWLWQLKPDDPDSAYARSSDYGFNGRHWAWMVRNLARMARLQSLGLTKYTYYRDALENTRVYLMDEFVNGDDPIKQEWRVIGLNKGALKGSGTYNFTAWMESFIGQTLGHIIQLGFDEWMPVAEWHLEHLRRRIQYWGMKGIDNSHFTIKWIDNVRQPDGSWDQVFMYQREFATSAPYSEGRITQEFLDWPDDKLIDTRMRGAKGGFLTYANRAQYAYGWAALQAQAGVPGARELADQIDAAITERGDVRDFKNTPAL